MPIDVQIDGKKVAQFLDGTSQEIIDMVMRRDFFSGKANQPPAPAPPELLNKNVQPAPVDMGQYDPMAMMGRLAGAPGRGDMGLTQPKPQVQAPQPDPKQKMVYQMGERARKQGTKQYELFKKSYPDVAKEIEYGELPINPRQVAELIEPIVKPLRGAGYSLFKGVNEGMKALSQGLEEGAEYIAKKTGTTKGEAFKRAAEVYDNNSKYWAEKAKEGGTGPVTEFLMEVIGGAGPGIGEFMTGVPMYGLKGAAKAGKKGESEVVGAVKGAMERFTMGKLMHTFARMTTAPRAGATGVLFEEQARAEGEKDPKALAKAAATGAIFGIPGKGQVRTKDIVKEMFKLEKEARTNVQAMDKKPSSIIGDERGAVGPKEQEVAQTPPFSPALKVGDQVFQVDMEAAGTHGDAYNKVPRELLEKADRGELSIDSGYVDNRTGKWVTEEEMKKPKTVPQDVAQGTDRLVPAVRYEGETYKGEVGDRHPEVMKKNGIRPEEEHTRGFMTPEGKFLSRAQGKQWMKRNNPELYKEWEKVVEGESPEQIIIERRGKEGESYAPKGESTIEYGEKISQYSLSPSANIYRGNSSYDFIDKNVDLDSGDPLLTPYGIKSWRELMGDGGIGDIGNSKYQRELSSGTQSRFFQLMQSKAKEILKDKGFDGAEWGNEDALNPRQYQIWNNNVINPIEGKDKPLHSEDLNTAQGLPEKPEKGGTTLGTGLGGGQDVLKGLARWLSPTAETVKTKGEKVMPAEEWQKRVEAWGSKNPHVKDENQWNGITAWLESKRGKK